MKKLFDVIIKHRVAVLIITAVLCAACIVSMLGTNINSDMSSYLDDSSVTKQTMKALSESFGIDGDATVCVQGELSDYDSVAGLVSELSEVENISSIAWLGSYSGLFTTDSGEIVSADPMLETQRVQALCSDWFKLSEGKGYYLLTVSIAAGNSSAEASVAMDEFADILSEYSAKTGADYYLGGSVMQGKNMLDSALSELPVFIIAAVIIIGIILFFTSKSLVSALIFLGTIGISIVLNMGTNFFTDSVSIATFSVAAILQLALSMDYSIFLTHSYEAEEKAGNPDALYTAVKKTSVVILASALTTIAGFCALFFMRYHMGADLGLCLAKGVSLSLITVVIVQPCLMVTLKKACQKTEHKTLQPRFTRLGCYCVKNRYILIAVAVILLIPSVFFSSSLDYYYLETDYSDTATGAQKVATEAGSQMIFVVPLADDDAQVEMLKRLRTLQDDGRIAGISGFYAMADTLFGGFEIPFGDDENDPSLKLDVADILSVVSSGGEITQESAPGLTAKVAQLIEALAKTEVTRQAVRFATSAGREPTEAEISSITERVVPQIQRQVTNKLQSQMGNYTQSLSSYTELINTAKAGFIGEVDGKQYTYFAVSVTGAAEGDEAIATVEKIEEDIYSVFGKDTRYLAAGSSETVRELASLTSRDFTVVALFSVALILIILFFTFKALWLPLVMVAVIELAILLNMSLTAVTGSSINFMTYIIITAIQMGATIDYAILLVKNYRSALPECSNSGQAVIRAVDESAYSILISASILAGACFAVYFISGNTLIREITLMVGRGAIISAAMVLLLLPSMLSLGKDSHLFGKIWTMKDKS